MLVLKFVMARTVLANVIQQAGLSSVVSVVPTATVTVRDRVTSELTTLYTTETGGSTASNPVSVDSSARFETWIEEGRYQLTVAATGFPTRTANVDLQTPIHGRGPTVKTYGAVGLGTSTTGTINASTNSLTVASPTSFAVGQWVYITDPAGYYPHDITAKISVITGSVFTLVDASNVAISAPVTLTGATVQHDDTHAIQAALDAEVIVDFADVVGGYGINMQVGIRTPSNRILRANGYSGRLVRLGSVPLALSVRWIQNQDTVNGNNNIAFQKLYFDGRGPVTTPQTTSTGSYTGPGPSTITVTSTAGFCDPAVIGSNMSLRMRDNTGDYQTITYTGMTSNSFTGCTGGGTSTFASGTDVQQNMLVLANVGMRITATPTGTARCRHITMENCIWANWPGPVVHFQHCQNFAVRNNEWFGGQRGAIVLWYECAYGVVNTNIIRDNLDDGIAVQASAAALTPNWPAPHDITFTGNQISHMDALGQTTNNCFSFNGLTDSVCSGNVCDRALYSQKAGIAMSDSPGIGTTFYPKRLLITGNRINDPDGYGIALGSAAAENITIRANMISNSGLDGISVSLSGPTAVLRNIRIEDNDLIGCGVDITTNTAINEAQFTMPHATWTVENTDGFTASGTFRVIDIFGVYQTITYTGKTSTTFTGCTSTITPTFANDTIVQQLGNDRDGFRLQTTSALAKIYGLYVSRNRFYQCKNRAVSIGKALVATPTVFPFTYNVRVNQNEIYDGNHGSNTNIEHIYLRNARGGQILDNNFYEEPQATTTLNEAGFSMPGHATWTVVSTTNFGTTGSFKALDDTGVFRTITYTGKSGTTFTGCTGGGAFSNTTEIYQNPKRAKYSLNVDTTCSGLTVRGTNALDTDFTTSAVKLISAGVLAQFPARYRTWSANTSATSGTDVTPVAGTIYIAEIWVEHTGVITGIKILNGSALGAANIGLVLFNSIGDKVATSAATLPSGSINTFQAVPFTTAYNPPAPGQYFVGVQAQQNTYRFRAIPAGSTESATTSITGTFGTVPAVLPPSTFTADVGPIAVTYT